MIRNSCRTTPDVFHRPNPSRHGPIFIPGAFDRIRGANADGTVAPSMAATGEIPEQYRGARPSERETVDLAGLGLRWLLDGPTNLVRLRRDSNVEDRAGSERRSRRHQDRGNIHSRIVSNRRLRGELGPLAVDPRPNARNRPSLPVHRVQVVRPPPPLPGQPPVPTTSVIRQTIFGTGSPSFREPKT
jgi:hypothetical protein